MNISGTFTRGNLPGCEADHFLLSLKMSAAVTCLAACLHDFHKEILPNFDINQKDMMENITSYSAG